MAYLLLKMVHTFAAALSLSGFVLRGYWMLRDSSLLQRRFTKVAPHVVDTLFFGAGVALAVMLGNATLTQPWMLTKLIGLLVYIALGVVALKLGRTRSARALAFVAAILVYIHIVGVAIAKAPAGWFVLLQ